MIKPSFPLRVIFFFALSVGLLIFVRGLTLDTENQTHHSWIADKSFVMDRVISGPLHSLFADSMVLDVFSIFYNVKRKGLEKESEFIEPYLLRAQNLDPRFMDVYRLATSLLAFDANMPSAAVDLLDKGSLVLETNWEIPFFGGFIAYQLLHNNDKAFNLMKRVLDRPGAPPIAIGLAVRFLNNQTSEEDMRLFLTGLLNTMPVEYRDGILDRIKMLKGKNL